MVTSFLKIRIPVGYSIEATHFFILLKSLKIYAKYSPQGKSTNDQSLISQPLQRVIEHICRDEMSETGIGD